MHYLITTSFNPLSIIINSLVLLEISLLNTVN